MLTTACLPAKLRSTLVLPSLPLAICKVNESCELNLVGQTKTSERILWKLKEDEARGHPNRYSMVRKGVA